MTPHGARARPGRAQPEPGTPASGMTSTVGCRPAPTNRLSVRYPLVTVAIPVQTSGRSRPKASGSALAPTYSNVDIGVGEMADDSGGAVIVARYGDCVRRLDRRGQPRYRARPAALKSAAAG